MMRVSVGLTALMLGCGGIPPAYTTPSGIEVTFLDDNDGTEAVRYTTLEVDTVRHITEELTETQIEDNAIDLLVRTHRFQCGRQVVYGCVTGDRIQIASYPTGTPAHCIAYTALSHELGHMIHGELYGHRDSKHENLGFWHLANVEAFNATAAELCGFDDALRVDAPLDVPDFNAMCDATK